MVKVIESGLSPYEYDYEFDGLTDEGKSFWRWYYNLKLDAVKDVDDIIDKLGYSDYFFTDGDTELPTATDDMYKDVKSMSSRVDESFKVSVTGADDGEYSMAEVIADNAAGEYDAITGYETLLNKMIEFGVPQEDMDKIYEIISDEKNHAQVLHELLQKYDNIETAKD